MRFLKNVLSQMHTYILWLLLSAVFWGWIFSAFVTDTKPEKKVVVYVDAECEEKQLDLLLEDPMPEGLRMVRCHAFSYAVFDADALLNADLFIVPASDIEEYLDVFMPVTAPLPSPYGEPWTREGVVYGMKVYDAADRRGAAGSCISYAPGEDHYLFFGKNSLHAAVFTGTGDDAAVQVAQRLLSSGQAPP